MSESRPWLILCCKLSEAAANEADKTTLSNLFFGAGGLNDYWRDVSCNTIDLLGSTVRGWYTLPYTAASLRATAKNDRATILQTCIAEVVRLDKLAGRTADYARFVGVIVYTNVNVDGNSNNGSYTFGDQVLSIGCILLSPWRLGEHGYLAHEMAHGFGLADAKHERDPMVAYQDPWSIMNYENAYSKVDTTYKKIGPGLVASELVKLGWLPAEVTWTLGKDPLGADGIQTIAALNLPYTTNLHRVLCVGPYTVEYRHPSGWDAGIPRSGVLIHRVTDDLSVLVGPAPDLQTGWMYHDKESGIILGVKLIVDVMKFAQVFVRRMGQPGWARCDACRGLYYAGSAAAAGVCPASAAGHRSVLGARYAVSHNDPSDPGQPGWAYCRACASLVYSGGGVCPQREGGHDVTGSGQYRMAGGAAMGEGGWLWCSKCNGLYQPKDDPMLPVNKRSVCPKGGAHGEQPSGAYVMNLALSPPVQQSDWRRCSRCSGLYHDPDGVDGGGICSDGQPHRGHSDKDYGVLMGGAAPGVTSGWAWCRRCSGMYFKDKAEGLMCTGAEPHDFVGSGAYHFSSEETAVGVHEWSRCQSCQALYDTTNPGICRHWSPATVLHDATERYTVPDARPLERDWRFCRRCACLVSGAAAGGRCKDGRPHDLAGSSDYVLHRNTAWHGEQGGWSACVHCEGLYYQPGGAGVCWAHPGGHQPRSGSDYRLIYTVTSADLWGKPPRQQYQDGWRWCTTCQGVFHLPSQQAATDSHLCPSGGLHTIYPGSGDYYLNMA